MHAFRSCSFSPQTFRGVSDGRAPRQLPRPGGLSAACLLRSPPHGRSWPPLSTPAHSRPLARLLAPRGPRSAPRLPASLRPRGPASRQSLGLGPGLGKCRRAQPVITATDAEAVTLGRESGPTGAQEAGRLSRLRKVPVPTAGRRESGARESLRSARSHSEGEDEDEPPALPALKRPTSSRTARRPRGPGALNVHADGPVRTRVKHGQHSAPTEASEMAPRTDAPGSVPRPPPPVRHLTAASCHVSAGPPRGSKSPRSSVPQKYPPASEKGQRAVQDPARPPREPSAAQGTASENSVAGAGMRLLLARHCAIESPRGQRASVTDARFPAAPSRGPPKDVGEERRILFHRFRNRHDTRRRMIGPS